MLDNIISDFRERLSASVSNAEIDKAIAAIRSHKAKPRKSKL
jgi:hypothetical protein